MTITSRENETIKYIYKLKVKKYRDRENKFLIDGYNSISFAEKNTIAIETLFVCPSLFKTKFDNNTLINNITKKKISVIEVSQNVFAKIGSSDNPDGLLALASKNYKYLKNYSANEVGLYIALESIEQPHNLGAIIRLADNAGAVGVLICDIRADLYDSETIRSSLGTLFSVNILLCESYGAVKWCKDNNIKIITTSPEAQSSYTDINMAEPAIIVLGAEHGGLSEKWLLQADKNVKIPMLGQANSLSVSASAAVMLYEALRQRGEIT